MMKFVTFFRFGILLVFLGSLTVKSAMAQKFTGKLILGFNGSQLDGDGMSGYHRAGLLAGAGVYFPVSEQWSVGPEFCYSMKGAQTSSAELEKFNNRIIYKLNYIDLPVVATCRIRPGFSAMAGLQASYLLKAQVDPGFNSTGFTDISPLLKKVDYMILFGLEYRLLDNIWLTGRFNYSLVSTNAVGVTNGNYALMGSPSRGGFYNNLIQFSLRFRLFGGDEDARQAGSDLGVQ